MHFEPERRECGAIKTTGIQIKKLLEDEKKRKTLERAIGMTDLESFTYYVHGGEKSYELAKLVLQWFSLGYGFVLPEASLKRHSPRKEEKEADLKAFVNKFAVQIKELIKQEPRLERRDDGTYVTILFTMRSEDFRRSSFREKLMALF